MLFELTFVRFFEPKSNSGQILTFVVESIEVVLRKLRNSYALEIY